MIRDRSRAGEDPPRDADNQWQQLSQRHFEPDRDGELTTAIVFAIADARGVEPAEIRSPPLYDVVDVPAIENAFFGSGSDGGSAPGTGAVEFQYSEHLVKVGSDGWIQVYGTNEVSEA